MDTSPHILVVEDTMVAQVVIKNQMMKLGCIVDTASDGLSAIEKGLTIHYDLILMDIGLGDGPNGFDVAIEIKKQNQINTLTPIMAVTAHGEPEFNDKALAVGMVGYFPKPFKPDDAKTIMDFLNNTLSE